jgi:uncharacterized BrkB/YihY/UPF0761 family membrane protein
MPSLSNFGGLTWRDFGKRVWNEMQKDEVFGRAAEVSYYFLLALFPLLIFLTSVIGVVLGTGTGTRHTLFSYLSHLMPPAAFQLIDYGSLGAVIILMLCLYFTGASILIGGEINSEIENAAAKHGAPEAKEKGEKEPQGNSAQAA